MLSSLSSGGLPRVVRDRYKPALRDGVARALSAFRATSPGRFARGALTAVTFHRVLPADKLRAYPMPGLAVTPEQLEAILTQLQAHFECTTLIDAYRSWREIGRGRQSGLPVLGVTFDDGALDNYEHAKPVLDRLGIRASFYVPVDNVERGEAPWHDRLGFALLRAVAELRRQPDVDFEESLLPFGVSSKDLFAVLPREAVSICQRGVERSKALSPGARAAGLEALEANLGGQGVPDWAGMMSWEQVRELSQEGHEVGSHSMTHALLPHCARPRLHEEIDGSRRRLQEVLEGDVSSFCYPNGSYDSRCLDEVRSAGYECAVTTVWGLNRPRRARPFELARCDMDYARLVTRRGDFSPERLMLRLSGLQPGL